MKKVPINIPDSIFEAVHKGMQGVMETGTGRGSKIPGIIVCGKTGTVENYYRGVKQPNHSFFCAFAPRENPRIAIMCVVENSGRFGGTYAGPIVSLMIEKYINDTISKNRKALLDRMEKTNLIPPLMQQKMKTKDSLQKAKEGQVLKDGLKNIVDPPQSVLKPGETKERSGKAKSNKKPGDTQNKKPVKKEMVIPEKQRNPTSSPKDTAGR